MQDNVLIDIKGLVKQYPTGGGRKFTALDGINMVVREGEFMGIVGPSGSGKTTLLNIIGALDNPTEGRAIVLGKDTNELTHKQAAELRNKYLGFIFQTYNLLPVYTVYENVEFPLLLLGKSSTERRKLVLEALDRVGLSDKVKSKPAQLSGGEAQRVAIARAIVKKPKIILADEPTANLDAANSYNVLNIMDDLNSEFGSTFIFATHDHKVIRYLRRKVTLRDGRIVEDIEVEPDKPERGV